MLAGAAPTTAYADNPSTPNNFPPQNQAQNVAPQPPQNSSSNANQPLQLDPDELRAIAEQLKTLSPPALDVRDGTGIEDLKTQLGARDPKTSNEKILGALNSNQNILNSQDSHPTKVLNMVGLSPLEVRYSTRAGQRLEQFGYDIFSENNTRQPAPGTLGDNYILGPGDRVMVVLRGAQSRVQSYPIGDDGRVVVDDIRPITATGRPLGDVAQEIEKEIAGKLLDTQAYVSLSQLRAVNIQVLGEVARPGRQTLSAYGGVMDALNAAGGIRKTGSLRRLQLSRADGTAQTLDLYQLLLTGSREVDFQLKDGDRILVPPLGGTMAIAGPVKRAGIYEIIDQNKDITLQQALYLAGETKLPAGLRFMRVRTDSAGNEQFVSLVDPDATQLSDQDVLIAESKGDAPRRVVMVTGNVRAPGPVPLDEARTLSALLGDGANIADNTYPLIGIIERTDSKTLEKAYVPFDPQHALAGRDKTPLRDGDRVKLFSDNDISRLTAEPASLVTSKNTVFDSGTGQDELKESLPPTQRVLADHIVTLHGAVARPGNYPIASDTPLSEIIGAAGGMTRMADHSSIEVVSLHADDSGEEFPERKAYDINTQSPSSILIPVGASVRINPKTDLVERKGVWIDGEVARPGHYDIMRGEKLSSLIARAGGMTAEAYPAGTVFMRESARRQEAAQYTVAAQQLEDNIAHMLTTDKNPNNQQIDVARQLANELRNAPAVGRITVEADPDVLRVRPEEDVLLEPGDHIVVPPRRQNVAVSGEVHAPANLQFVDGKAPEQYLHEAGGFTRFADEHQVFVIGPNGASKREGGYHAGINHCGAA
jgi:protein involved in polysaccharide export with SLBB domain